MTTNSNELFARAQQLIPGGVNSPVRAFKAVGGAPRFISRAAGSRIVDVEGREYIDYVGSWGPMILGHAHPAVVEAIASAAARGTSYGAPTAAEIEMAELISTALPSMEMVRMVSSGTEAVMSAIRLARGFTNRKKILKFEGCYHGHADSLLSKAGSGLATLGLPSTPGVPPELAALTLTAPYNDLDAVRAVFQEHGRDIACIIIEPVAGNMGVVPPRPGFLEALRQLTHEAGTLLIFDEVITGFRLCHGGYQTLAGIRPDLTCLGKIIGGGMPVGAFGGRKDIMDMLAPNGPVYQAGTLSGNPLAMAAGIATLRALQEQGFYDALARKTASLCQAMTDCFESAGVPVRLNRMGSMFTFFFTTDEVCNFETALKCDTQRYARYFNAMLDSGINLPPSQFEAAFVSGAHSETDLETTAAMCRKVCASI